jgi:succinoglycan biosynthesis transport protein ExoP
MHEELEEQTTPLDLDRYLDILRRRHLVFLGVLLLGWGMVWGGSFLVPPRYKSTTTILVEPPSMPSNYVVPNVSENLQAQIQSIAEQIKSKTGLLRIIAKLNLYRDDKGHFTSPDQKVEAMRKDIGVDLVRGPEDNSINAFKVSYIASDPHIAQQVTSELTNLFITENLSIRQEQSEGTTQFLQEQLQIARSNLAEQDAKVRAFQSTHEGSLPSQEASNLQILSGLQSQLQNEQDALNVAHQQQVYHQSMIDQYRALDVTGRTANGAPSGLASIDQQLDELRSKLSDLRSRYTDQYPEVQDLEAQVARLEKTREQAVAALRNASKSIDRGSNSQKYAVGDASSSAPLLQFQSQLKVDQAEIASRERSIAVLKDRINQYQSRLSDEPAVAQQLADLTRGYEQSQANYNDLLKKVSDSRMATNMEQLQEGERFTMIDPPSLPAKPSSPNRLKMCGTGVGAGLALGIVVVALLELLDDQLHSTKEIEKLLPVAVISEVPEILEPSDERRIQRRAFWGWALAAGVTVVILAGAAFSYLSA